jgi:lipooligosaccharide transport system permease protein
MLWIFIEPMLYIFAFGFGLGRFVAHIDGVNYAEFIAPGLMATSGMFVAFFEGTYGTYVKLSRQNTFSTIILTPVGSDEITLGEILWAASKAFLSVISVTAVLAVMGLVPIVRLAPAAAVLFVLCWVFAAMGVWLASIARSFEWFTYAQSGFVLPMSLFCGTYFPLSQMPTFLQKLALLLPLTHALQSVRMFFAGEFNSMFFVNMMYLFVLGIIFTNLASARFERKLVV